ncbi:MAG: bifunctional 5,10-methylene-tetrahydrofolate dehydrogenase/5,10-methylene-tetrahydrofolate cyclohydrolase, partial [Oscillospiraceae bacterium]|nr:bifunctional 5,10-methylene-tetrahydrofolate dehydrogenase/5,10-methylene-tetrahydrofolate cyclohydrolase [Oscillospiraceae bacterium]
MAELYKGAPVAAAITEALKTRADALKEKGVEPCLAILRVGERPEDLTYERGAMKRCEKIGIRVEQIVLNDTCSQSELLHAI